MIIGSAIGGGFLAVWMFVPTAQNGATVGPSIADAFWFIVGAVIGAGAGLSGVFVLGSLALEYLYSSGDDTMGSRHY